MRAVAIIQGRTGSTRLPGKVLMEIAGEPMLVRAVNRARRVARVDDVVVATTMLGADDTIANLCADRGWAYFRGSEEDVLDRYYRAALAHRAGLVVGITSDCPLVEPLIVDRIVDTFLEAQPHVQYVSNAIPRRTFPHGLDAEAIRFDALQEASRPDRNPPWREHTSRRTSTASRSDFRPQP